MRSGWWEERDCSIEGLLDMFISSSVLCTRRRARSRGNGGWDERDCSIEGLCDNYVYI